MWMVELVGECPVGHTAAEDNYKIEALAIRELSVRTADHSNMRKSWCAKGHFQQGTPRNASRRPDIRERGEH